MSPKGTQHDRKPMPPTTHEKNIFPACVKLGSCLLSDSGMKTIYNVLRRYELRLYSSDKSISRVNS